MRFVIQSTASYTLIMHQTTQSRLPNASTGVKSSRLMWLRQDKHLSSISALIWVIPIDITEVIKLIDMQPPWELL